jgi:hypothetical protein
LAIIRGNFFLVKGFFGFLEGGKDAFPLIEAIGRES